MPDQLYVWANPLRRLKRFDHTWVTSYDAPFSCTKNGPPQHFWYCWGTCHAAGPGTTARALGSAPGVLATARCLCRPDDSISRPGRESVGGINLYGIQGVCHQVANRVLFATTTTPTLTVAGAHGYDDSRNVYGTYGTNVRAWKNRVKRCTGRDIDFPTVREEFLTRLQQELHLDAPTAAEAQRIHDRLLQDHDELCQEVLSGALNGRQFADQTNTRYHEARQAWAGALHANDFLFYFQAPPGDVATIIDPDVAADADYTRHEQKTVGRGTHVIITHKKTTARPMKYAAKKAAKRAAPRAKAAKKGRAARKAARRSRR